MQLFMSVAGQTPDQNKTRCVESGYCISEVFLVASQHRCDLTCLPTTFSSLNMVNLFAVHI